MPTHGTAGGVYPAVCSLVDQMETSSVSPVQPPVNVRARAPTAKCGPSDASGISARVPLFTPSTKAASGAHDENIDFEQTKNLLGPELAEKVREASLAIYRRCAAYALARGIIIADTKFEFGTDRDGRLVLIDEVLTPDSSRFWPADSYAAGISPVSFDKQYVRDYLETLDWDKRPPGPKLPDEIIARTAEKYREAQRRLTS